MVGSEFQAKIPSGLCKYGDVLPYENEDKLLWGEFSQFFHNFHLILNLSITDPTKLSEQTTEEYLHKAVLASSSLPTAVPLGKHLRDDEEVPLAKCFQSQSIQNLFFSRFFCCCLLVSVSKKPTGGLPI
jgi:ELM2 domain